jgi:hypothetical protein
MVHLMVLSAPSRRPLSTTSTVAEAIGPALSFWHECALTARFVCEGPFSRTDMAGLAQYHRLQLQALRQLDMPIDSRLFEELI